METQRYVTKPMFVEAVAVTEDNMHEVAEWVSGSICKNDQKNPRNYVSVTTIRPLNVRQTQAYVGDWVLKTESGFKIYTRKAFSENFDPAECILPGSLPEQK